MKHIRYITFLVVINGLIPFLGGCIKSDSGCLVQPDDQLQGIQVYFYSRTSCQAETNYPAEINTLLIGVFNREDLLVYHTEVENVVLAEDFFQQIELNSGLYTVRAWAGLDKDLYELQELQDSVTTATSIFLRLRSTDTIAYPVEDRKLFYGESTAVYVAEGTEAEPGWERVTVNMQELINRLTIQAEGLSRINEYEFIVEADNSVLNLDGTIREGGLVEYVASGSVVNGIIEVDLTLLTLQSGYANTLIIRNVTLDEELFRGNLLGTLLLKNPEVNLACDHDFVIRFAAEDQCDCGTYVITEIWVNNWLVHSYETTM